MINARHYILFLILLVFSFLLVSCDSKPIIRKTDSPKPVEPFAITDVKLLDGPFKHAIELNVKSLLAYEPDRLLARFRKQADLEPKAEQYGGWESESIAGHSLGHYLSACALMYETTGNEEFKMRANYIVSELQTVQETYGDGYIGAFNNGKTIFEEEVANGEIRSSGFDLNGIWSPFYTSHKVMAGLRDAYRLLGNQQALEVERKFADWVGSIVLPLSHDRIQEMLNTEFGGIQETLADLYEDTHDKKYLEIAEVFHHDAIIDPLAEGVDILPGKHGNTQIPKLIASSRLYEITGDTAYRRPAEFFWDRVVNHHSYVTGGHGNHEYFGKPDTLRNRLSDETTETCNVYNMLKLSRHLFLWNPRAEVADFYERGLFNQIISSQHPESGKVIYNLSLEMGGYKHYEDPYGFTCCVGTGMENHSKYGANIYYKNEDELYVSQYIASELKWKEKNLSLTQNTKYLEEDTTEFTFSMDNPQKFTFYVRYPQWSHKGIIIKINGKEQKVDGDPGRFLAIEREWNNDDQVTVKIPFSLRLETMPDDENRVAVFNGPIVLAGILGPVDDEKARDMDYVPILMSEDRNPENWLSKVEGKTNTFKTNAVGKPRDVVMKPFYKTHDERYSVYFDLFTKQRWQEYKQQNREAEEKAKKLEAMTFDGFQPGEMQTERNHTFNGDKLTLIEDFRGRKARGAERGGWMSFDMKVMMAEPMVLVMEYWGGYTGSKTFDILIDGTKIATENISGKKDGEFIKVAYEITFELTKTKDKVTVKLNPHEGHRAGPFFYARTLKQGKELIQDMRK